jgi:hypothetical protein
MRLLANSVLRGEYGLVTTDQEFEARDEIGKKLVSSGMARTATPPRIEYETKVIVPQALEASTRTPFRDVSVSHEESASVASEGDTELSIADVQATVARAANHLGRRGRSGSST